MRCCCVISNSVVVVVVVIEFRRFNKAGRSINVSSNFTGGRWGGLSLPQYEYSSL